MGRPEWTPERAEGVEQRYQQIIAFKKRFGEIFSKTDDERAQRLAREIAIDGDLTTIPAAHRLTVARQLIIALYQAGFIDYELDEAEEQWRTIAARLGVPYLEVFHAIRADLGRGDATRSDIDEWLAWAREHAPERLQAAAKGGE